LLDGDNLPKASCLIEVKLRLDQNRELAPCFDLLASSLTPPTSTTEYDRHTKHEAEVVPAAVVEDFIDVDVLVEQRDDEGERRDDPVP
jgi:hypothetical protein